MSCGVEFGAQLGANFAAQFVAKLCAHGVHRHTPAVRAQALVFFAQLAQLGRQRARLTHHRAKRLVGGVGVRPALGFGKPRLGHLLHRRPGRYRVGLTLLVEDHADHHGGDQDQQRGELVL